MVFKLWIRCATFAIAVLASHASIAEQTTPNIVLIMADDMGWGQTGYYLHPVLKTPNLDAMAENGLRFDRFYAGAPVCSPTRATVLTGRTNDRTGVTHVGVPLRRQERTIAQALADAGYATGHFGKWHLNGIRGPGVPILGDDPRSPGQFGFLTWLSATNFIDRNPILSRRGEFEEFAGDSSEIIVDEALDFIRRQCQADTPFFAVIWFGSPHNPFVATDADKEAFRKLDPRSAAHYGELAAMDRSIGTLRAGLRDLRVAQRTLLWFCSDNGGLPNIKPDTVGGLRGFKGSLYEGGIRVPAIIEWPDGIATRRITTYPASTIDIFPTLAEVVELPEPTPALHQDGTSLKPLFLQKIARREAPIGFRHSGRTALIDNNHKLLRVETTDAKATEGETFELYDLANDPSETTNLREKLPKVASRMIKTMSDWNASVQISVDWRDYPAGDVVPTDPAPRHWKEMDAYRPYFDEWKQRPEYRAALK